MNAVELQQFTGNPDGLIRFVLEGNWDEETLFPLLTPETQETFNNLHSPINSVYTNQCMEARKKFIKVQKAEVQRMAVDPTCFGKGRKMVDLAYDDLLNTLSSLVRWYNNECCAIWAVLFQDPKNRFEQWR